MTLSCVVRRPSEDGEEDGKAEQEVVVCAAKRVAATEPAAASQQGIGADGIKWKKIARKVLQRQPGGALKLKNLQRLALEAAQLPAGVDRAAAASSLEARIRRSTMFVFQDKLVSLAQR